MKDEMQAVQVKNVDITGKRLTVDLEDGRTISIPLDWYPRLWHGNPKEQQNWRLIGAGTGIHWPDLDEDISLEGLLFGKRSGENQSSLNRWLEKRTETVSVGA